MHKFVYWSVLINLLFTAFLYSWVTDDDIVGLPSDAAGRFGSLFFFSISTFTSTGDGTVAAHSTRARMVLSTYMLGTFIMIYEHLFK